MLFCLTVPPDVMTTRCRFATPCSATNALIRASVAASGAAPAVSAKNASTTAASVAMILVLLKPNTAYQLHWTKPQETGHVKRKKRRVGGTESSSQKNYRKAQNEGRRKMRQNGTEEEIELSQGPGHPMSQSRKRHSSVVGMSNRTVEWQRRGQADCIASLKNLGKKR